MLEREPELAAIEALLEDAAGGTGRAVLLEGEAGTGKTELVRAARERASERGLGELAARGGELEREFAFGVVRQLFDRRLVGPADHESDGLFDGSASTARALLLPDADTMTTGSPPAPGAVLHGLYWLCANLAERGPLLLVLDDLHWADESSVRFLAYLVRRIEGLPIAVLAAARPIEPGTDPGLLEPLRREPLVERLQLADLSEAATSAFLEAAFEDPESGFVTACHAATRGNPFLLRELVAHLSAQGLPPSALEGERLEALGPVNVARSVIGRVDRLDPPAPALARAVAVLGSGADLRHSAALAGTTVEEASTAADGLAAISVLMSDRPLEFVHPLVRAALHANLAAGERSRAHARAATVLAADGAAAERVAAHLLNVDPGTDEDGAVVDVLSRAADEATVRGSPEAAAIYLSRALHEPLGPTGRSRLLLRLGNAEFASGAPTATQHLQKALGSADGAIERAHAARALARSLIWANRMPEAVGILEAAREKLPESEVELGRLVDADLVTSALLHPETLETRHRRLSPYRANSPSGSTHGERLLLVQLAVDSAQRGAGIEETAELASRALAGDTLLAEEGGDSMQITSAARCLAVAERFSEAHEVLSRALGEAQRSGSSYAYAASLTFRCEVNHRWGALEEAEADGLLARDLMKEVGSQWGELVAVQFVASPLVERGRIAEAAEMFAVTGMDGPLPPPFVFAGVALARATVRRAQGRLDDALADWLECGARETAWREPNPAVFAWRSEAALAHLSLGDADEARRLAEEELALARRYGASRGVGISLRALGLIAEAAGQPARGRELLREAVSTLEHSDARLERARALTDLGAVIRRGGGASAARSVLREGLDLAHRCGATVLAERARSEIVAAGGRPRRAAMSGADSLTPSELRIARLASAGATNREIAQELFVTAKTVETHLTSVFRKLEISSRKDIGSALASET